MVHAFEDSCSSYIRCLFFATTNISSIIATTPAVRRQYDCWDGLKIVTITNRGVGLGTANQTYTKVPINGDGQGAEANVPGGFFFPCTYQGLVGVMLCVSKAASTALSKANTNTCMQYVRNGVRNSWIWTRISMTV